MARSECGRIGWEADVAALFEETLDEEKEADEKLTTIAENLVNPRAAQSGEREEDEREMSTRTRARKASAPSIPPPRTVRATAERGADSPLHPGDAEFGRSQYRNPQIRHDPSIA